jgi:hypothetical protein
MTRRFINGPLRGTKVEIMSSKDATQLPNGIPIKPMSKTPVRNDTQLSHEAWKIDVHEPQFYTIEDKRYKTKTTYVGPSIAQEWKLLYQNRRPFYQVANVERV